ncbi:trimeric intracellular cation channel family protein [Sediminitomix flava]|uniref:Putative membrane protein YeiH n=1 Tax=Sediminitomix flava TaxID=379075 RepID=A0A315Z7G2_SEDFL|nr:trimeric intracellular cation channel family protein [Sediminitomix flava]PWJ38541.1 putative membrane protein YeiH [Sediminitomix flava]
MNSTEFYYLLGMIGIVAFAVTAVLAVIPKGIDLFGACVMGIITAVGGGTIRDMILDVPVFWSQDLNYIWVSLFASIIAFYGYRLMNKRHIYQLMLYLDGLGVAMFIVQGADKAIALDFGMPVGPVILGLTTAIGGGLIRDVLAGTSTLLMKKDLYAVPLTIGAVLYMILLNEYPDYSNIIGVGCATFTFILRAIAIYREMKVPNWMMLKAYANDQMK